jgi:hypothetical protein
MKHILEISLIASMLVALPSGASAWHGADEWQRGGRGDTLRFPGSGGLYYLGRREDHTMTCASCHVGGPGRVRANVTFTPALSSGRYAPGTRYRVDVAMSPEVMGLSGCSRRNTNSIVAFFSDPSGNNPAGTIFNDNQQRACGPSTLGTMQGVGATTIVRGNCEYASGQGGSTAANWRFHWDPPASGDVTFWLGLVDGDCVQRDGGAQTYDGDDVFMLEQPIPQGAMAWRFDAPGFVPQRLAVVDRMPKYAWVRRRDPLIVRG